MIINQTKNDIVREGTQTEHTFSFTSDAYGFSILSDMLYSNKIEAIIRELSCNAYDAHVDAGKADTPIEIKLPTKFDPTFYIKDYGIGLSDEEMYSIYTVCLKSTKRTSNTKIGAYGLGSKTPFCYTDNYIIESIYNGTKTTFSAFKNEENIPSLVVLGKQDTTEHNGLTVTISVKPDDIREFVDTTANVLSYFNPKPNVIGNDFKFSHVSHDTFTSKAKFRENLKPKHYGMCVIQGFVSYPIDKYAIEDAVGGDKFIWSLLDYNIDLFVDIGDVETTVSREALSYKPKTINKIIEMLQDIKKEVSCMISDDMSKCSTLWEAMCKRASYSQRRSLTEHENKYEQIKNLFIRNETILWNGKQVTNSVTLDFSKIKDVVLKEGEIYNDAVRMRELVSHTPSSVAKFTYHIDQRHIEVIVLDKNKNVTRTLKQYLKSKSYTSYQGYKYYPELLIIKPVDTKTDISASVADLVEQMGHPEVIYFSNLPEAPPASNGKVLKTKQQRYVLTRPTTSNFQNTNYTDFNASSWMIADVPASGPHVYVPISRYQPTYSNHRYYDLRVLLEYATEFKLVKQDFPLYGLTNREAEIAKKDKSWINLYDLVAEHVLSMYKSSALAPLLINRYMEATSGMYISKYVSCIHYFTRHITWREKINKDSPFIQFVTDIVNVYNDPMIDKQCRLIAKAANVTYVRVHIPTIATNACSTTLSPHIDVQKRYPLLGYLHTNHTITEDELNAIVGYINMVDEQNNNVV